MIGRLVICIILLDASLGCGTAPTPEFKVPTEATNTKNPFPATSDSIAEGKRSYRSSDCVICHGVNGDGKGSESRNISMNLHDWRDPSVQAKFTDGDFFYIIDKGESADRGSMPPYHDLETPQQIWHMVNYIRSFAPLSVR